ncbi:hypothetical protein TSAR_002161 [Trichomalopsis sarcophagae]|uniref:Uncharacterized protein n=1 Tax=Trichomalopsis sarcophagae TaxID=543379 RepID=A0A232EYJ0_9HYME|nr:hypothetical protein TSAR_002161 [Trichomalopsis sarcophagae]
MFSRAAKSIVQSLNQRSYHVSKGNFKAAIGSTGEVGTARFSQQPTLDSSAVQEIVPFKNLKFKNITSNSAEGQTRSGVGVRAVKGTAAEGNVHAIDLAQAAAVGDLRKSLLKFLQNDAKSFEKKSETLARKFLQPQIILFELFMKFYETLFENTNKRAYIAIFERLKEQHSVMSSKVVEFSLHLRRMNVVKKEKVEELKAKIKEIMQRINRKLGELKTLKEKHKKRLEADAKTKKDTEKQERKTNRKESSDETPKKQIEEKERPIEAKKEVQEEQKIKAAVAKNKTSSTADCGESKCPPVFRAPGCPPKSSNSLRGLGPIIGNPNGAPGFYKVPMKASGDFGDHVRNDDYFPQGEEYEDEIGSEGFIRPSEGLRLGSSDCGVPPIRRKKNPCDPPEGPCKPLPPPGYPSKPKPERKPFCVKCPPKKPCPENNC